MIRALSAALGVWLAFAGPAISAPEPTEALPRPIFPKPSPPSRGDNDAKTPKALVVVAQAREACFSLLIPVTGYLLARREAVVILLPGDSITEVSVAEGDTVQADQVLAQVTRPPRGPPAPGTAPTAETVALRAPAAGTVVRSTAAVGVTGSLVVTEPLFRIAIDGEIELEAEVPSFHVPELQPGRPARVLIDRDVELGGRVRLIPASVDPRTQIGRARISLGRNPRLKLATFARAFIDARRSCGISVPRAAVSYRSGGKSVQVVEGDIIKTRNVDIGLNSDIDVEITKGLSNGDRVVANAGTSLRDGDRVTTAEAATTTYEER